MRATAIHSDKESQYLLPRMMRHPWTSSFLAICAAAFSASAVRAQAAARWNLTRELRIGSSDRGKEYEFARIGGVAPGSNGAVFVSELRPPEIRVFDTGGNYVRTIGRTGDGPGEFRALGNIGFLGDTLWTVDGNLKRVSFFSTEGRVLATVQQTPREPAAPTPRVFFSADVWAVLPRDMAVGLTSAAWSAQEGNQVPVIPILRMTRSGRTLDTIAWTSTLHTRMTFIPAPGRRLTVGQPFADTPLTVVATAAERVYIVDRTAAAAVRDASFRVVALGLTRFDGHPVKSEIVNE